jgi:nucleoside-diphosphate-sugar epimerase
MMRCLITGGNGFVGRTLTRNALAQGYNVRLPLRQPEIVRKAVGVETIKIDNLSADRDWTDALSCIDKVVHLAARVHVMNDKSSDPLVEFRRLNVEGAANLARQAAAAGVRRFVYLSTIKVNGEFTQEGRPFSADDAPAPQDPYAVSKYEAELALRQIADETGMEVVIIRPPLVYGPGVKANFESMMRWLSRGIPLPLAAVTQNRRSLVALDNLVDLIMTCLSHPAAANQTFLVSDGEDLSTADLLERMGVALDQPVRLFYMPTSILKLGAQYVNKPGIYQRLCGSLQLDISKTRQLLTWTPPMSVNEGLLRAAEGFRV